MAKAQRFGSAHTGQKLEKLEEYLRAYSTALKNQGFELVYFDAFAGAGDVQIADADTTLLDGIDDYTPFIHGSAQRALSFKTAFNRYVFVDAKSANIEALNALRDQNSDIADRVVIKKGDANSELLDFCRSTNWKKTRAVVFLDPYGNQVKWETVEALAATKAIDLWYLFPAGLGVYRQISKKRGVHGTHERSLDDLFGTAEWREAFVETVRVTDLFGSREEQEKKATVESVTRFMADRLKTVFGGGVLDEWLPLGSRKIHMYSLMFAWANPDEKAKLAGKLALAVLRSDKGGGPK
ncbi:MAG TPA: three-Cys-motif partner protein TcmP [Rhizomicrobium sp.]|nr:three-Cys-motif partner protein TcmP [Rhizomicrobium sp.]